jgi:hypothetical protein
MQSQAAVNTSSFPQKFLDAVVIDQTIFDVLQKLDADPPGHDVADLESETIKSCTNNSCEVNQGDQDDEENCSDLPPPLPYFQQTPSMPSGHDLSNEKIHRSMSDTSLVQGPPSKFYLDKLRAKNMSKSLPNMRGCSRSIHNRSVGFTILDSANESSPDTGRYWALERIAEFEQLLEGL